MIVLSLAEIAAVHPRGLHRRRTRTHQPRSTCHLRHRGSGRAAVPPAPARRCRLHQGLRSVCLENFATVLQQDGPARPGRPL